MKLKAARDASGKTQAQVAMESSVTERMYQRYEYGTEPGVRTAIRIAKALNSSVEELFEEEQNEPGGNQTEGMVAAGGEERK